MVEDSRTEYDDQKPGPSGIQNGLNSTNQFSASVGIVEVADFDVSAISSTQLEENIVSPLRYRVDICDKGGNGFDKLIDLPASIRCGDKTPFEISHDKEAESDQCTSEEYIPSEEDSTDINEDFPLEEISDAISKRKSYQNRQSPSKKKLDKSKDMFKDDGNDSDFEARIRTYQTSMEIQQIEKRESENEEYRILKNGVKLVKSVWNKLYKYQKTGVRWLCELNEQCVGGILADEMGLGKTIQVIAFLRAIDESQKNEEYLNFTGLGGCLIICPATLMHQWVKEIHIWFPLCRVAVLHSSGNFRGTKSRLIAKMAINRKGGSILIASYSTFTKERKLLIKQNWHYVILDEGHKIRNPEAQVTLSLKELRTPYRIILSGSPLQNNLKELWSLIDFIYPGRLGSLKTFSEKFSIPITQGGYANATEIQATTAYKCALVLRDAINPFILRRLKSDVKQSIDLPEKNEQVLFCEISPEQRQLYREYLSSRECTRILKGVMDPFVGLILLRKLCNHPDLITGGPNKHGEFNVTEDPSKEFGWPLRSGKMIVVRNLLFLWKQDGHKVLIFSQSRQMLNILEKLMILDGHSYFRMDGLTSIGARQKMVHQFNNDINLFVFLLTTRVGGLGINLTGANKVLIFDPDWNPSTDTQARERAWRIGQNRPVTIYRLISTGTIEEKIYHRQIFKQFLANRILKDPKQRRFFKTNDLHELFTLTEMKDGEITETGAIFASETKEISKHNFFDRYEKEREELRKDRLKKKDHGDEEDDTTCIVSEQLTDERKEQLREIARKIARNIDPNKSCNPKKRKKRRLFDRKVNIPYLSKQRSAVSMQIEKKNYKAKDDYILGSLLKSSSVHSVLRHDDLIGDNPSNYLIEKEAESIARQAAKTIFRRPRSSFLDTFRAGFSNRQEKNSNKCDETENVTQFSGKAASSDYLTAIGLRKRKHLEDNDVEPPRDDKFSRMANELREYIFKRGGQAHTEEIVMAFKSKISCHEQRHFRAILKKICFFDPSKKEWRLKEEYL